MATKTFTVTKQYMADVSANTANPGDDHIPLGNWSAASSFTTRANLYAPVSFTGMTAINEARLYLYQHTAAGYHTKGSGTVGLYAYRKTVDWSETSGGASSSIDETWGTGDNAIVVNNIAGPADPNANINNGAADGTLTYIDITDIVAAWFNSGLPNYGVMLKAGSEGSSSASMEFYSRHSGSKPYIWIDYETNTAPNAPTSLNPTGDAVVNTGTTITVTGNRSDPDSGDYITGVDIRVYLDNGTTLIDSDTYYPTGSPVTFSRAVTVSNGNAFYKWQARTRDRESVWGPWSALQRFKANTVPNAPSISLTQTPTTSVKTLTPTFNITRSDSDSAYGDDMGAYQILLDNSSGVNVWDSGQIAVSAGTTSVQKLYNGPALSWNTTYNWRARTRDENNAWGPYTPSLVFTTFLAGTPINLSPTGNVVTSTLTPTLTGDRATTDYTISSYELELYESNGTTLKWSSGVLATGITNGASFAGVYNGAALSYSTQYKWRARVTGNIGGASAWSTLQTFTTRAADEVEQTAPIGNPVTSLTPNFTGTWTSTLNSRQIILYAADGTTQIWDSGEDAQTASTSFSTAYDGTALAWNTTYQWKARVRRSADNVWQPYTGLVSFTTDSAGQPTLTAPINDSWQTTLTPTFTGTTFAAEVISTYRILLYEEDEVTLKWDSGNLAGSGTSFSKVYNGGALVEGRTYKWQARYTKSTGPTGNYSALQSFHVNAAPQSPINLSPGTGGIVIGTLTPSFRGDFNDLDKDVWGDIPNQLEVEVRNNATDVLLTTLTRTDGLVAGTNSVRYLGTNMLANPGFETNTTGWSTANSTITRDLTVYRTGVAALKVVPTTAAAYSATTTVTISGATAGRTYYGGMWVYVDPANSIVGKEVRLFIRETGGASGQADTIVSTTLVAGWQFISGERTLTANDRTGISFFLNRTTGVALTEVYFIDDASLQPTATNPLVYETTYKWRMRYRDSKSVNGAWSSYNTFKPSQPSTVNLTGPSGSITSPQVPVTWNFSSPGGKTQGSYRVVVSRNSDEIVVYDSGTVLSTSTTHIIPAGYLQNNTAYTFAVTTVDTDGI